MKGAAIFLIPLFIWSCAESETTLKSSDYEEPVERVEVLKNEIIFSSDFMDAEFELFNVNGFSDERITQPGASSWDYKFGVKVDSKDLDKWIEGFSIVDSTGYDLSWTTQITGERSKAWTTTGTPEIYRRGNEDVIVILYRREGLIFKHVCTL